MRFLEAGKTLLTDSNGYFLLRTNEGRHTVIASAVGFLSDTAAIDLPPGMDGITVNFSLAVNTADMSVSVDSFHVELEVEKSAQETFIVSNFGGGILNFKVRDVVGPLGGARAQFPLPGEKKTFWKQFDYISKIKVNASRPLKSASRHLYRDLETIVVDPLGDVTSSPDVVAIRAAKDTGQVTIQVVVDGALDPGYFSGAISLDVDQDVETGLFPPVFGNSAQDLGADFAVFAFGLRQGYVTLFQLPDFSFINLFPVTLDSNRLTFSLPLAALNDDDGNINLAAVFGDADMLTDWVPDVGHGIIGIEPFADVPWLSESPITGSLAGGQSQEITVNLDASGLQPDTTYTGIILIEPLGVDIPATAIPVKLTTKSGPTSVGNDRLRMPKTFALGFNFPNPFNPWSTIQYQLPRVARVQLKIFDLEGRLIRVLVNDTKATGYHTVVWDGRDNEGGPVSSGVYFYQMKAGDFVKTRSMLLVK